MERAFAGALPGLLPFWHLGCWGGGVTTRDKFCGGNLYAVHLFALGRSVDPAEECLTCFTFGKL